MKSVTNRAAKYGEAGAAYSFRSKELAAPATVVATDAASQQSAPVTVRFRIAGR